MNESNPGPTLVRVADAKDIAEGEMRVFDVEGVKVNISRASGKYFAFDDTCTHAGCSLAAGKLDSTTVTCACHGSQFDIADGRVCADRRTSPCGRGASRCVGRTL